jgi:hypothetical protein
LGCSKSDILITDHLSVLKQELRESFESV